VSGILEGTGEKELFKMIKVFGSYINSFLKWFMVISLLASIVSIFVFGFAEIMGTDLLVNHLFIADISAVYISLFLIVGFIKAKLSVVLAAVIVPPIIVSSIVAYLMNFHSQAESVEIVKSHFTAMSLIPLWLIVINGYLSND